LEKEAGSECPGCGLLSLDVYYEDDCDSPIGAKCENCGFRGFFMREELVPLAAV
jgi:DNA-directed RNA polymerase subunit RPC12/RpoP